MKNDDATLRALAEAATPGPWKQTHDITRGVKLWSRDGVPLFQVISPATHAKVTPEDPTPQWQKDCDFVRACSPDAILGLLDRLAERPSREGTTFDDETFAAMLSAAERVADEVGCNSAAVYQQASRTITRLVRHLRRERAARLSVPGSRDL